MTFLCLLVLLRDGTGRTAELFLTLAGLGSRIAVFAQHCAWPDEP